jgi:hypothetical protein
MAYRYHDPKAGADHSHRLYDPAQARTWKFEDKSIAAEGTFLLAKDGKVFIEKENDVVSFPVEKLSWIDQKYVTRKLREIEEINSQRYLDRPAKKATNTSQWAQMLAGLILALILAMVLIRQKVHNTAMPVRALSALLIASLIVACTSRDGDTDETPSIGTSFTSDPEVMNAAFTPYSTVSTRWDDSYFYVESQGIPEHQMMVGITAWIAQVPTPHDYTGTNAWPIPLTATYADNPISIETDLQRGAIGIAANGIPIFNPLNASGLVSQQIGELDAYGGHSGRGDDYHYHTAPLHLESTSVLQPIAYALDGFAVYGSKEPDGTEMNALDNYHGHEYADSYHYHGTESYPYMIAAMRGEVALSGNSPQTQIEPQPVGQAFRGDPHPINSDNLVIDDLVEKAGGNGYILSYTSNGIQGSVDYSWDENGLYTFIFNDIDGSTTTETFQR